MNADTEVILRRAEAFCVSLAPHELSGQPFYLIDQSGLSSLGVPVPASPCLGYTHPLTSAIYRDSIGDRWQGPGPAAVLNTTDLLADDGWDYHLRAVALHELGHICNASRGPIVYRHELPRGTAVEHHAWAASSVDATFEAFDGPIDEQHGGPFIRVGCHLAARSQRTETPINPGAICAGWNYTRSHGSLYLAALGDEPQRMAGASFAEILSTPMPRAFKRLCQRDVSWWLRRQQRIAKESTCSSN